MFERGNPYKNVDKDGHQTEILFLAIGFLATFNALTELEVYKIKKEQGVNTEEDFEEAIGASVGAAFEVAGAGANVPGEQGSGVMFGLEGAKKNIKKIEKNLNYIKGTCSSNSGLNACSKNKDMITTDQFNKDVIGGSEYFDIEANQAQGAKVQGGQISVPRSPTYGVSGSGAHYGSSDKDVRRSTSQKAAAARRAAEWPFHLFVKLV